MPREAHLTEFESFLLNSENRLGSSVLLIIAWIASSDGKISDGEKRFISHIAEASSHGNETNDIIKIAISRDIAAIQLACEFVRKGFSGSKSRLFLQMAVGVAISDGYLKPSENYILRFIADLLSVNRKTLNEVFLEVSGKALPKPSDPSQAVYWESRKRSTGERNYRDRKDTGPSSSKARDQVTINAYSVLGLEIGASEEDIRTAYRRLAQIHHPDRFSSLGAEATAAATESFQRIQSAYNHLIKNA